MSRLKIIIYSCVLSMGLSSCYYDKFEDFKPKQICDTSYVMSYASVIKPLIDRSCEYSCHSGTNPSSGIPLDTYTTLKASAVSGQLMSALTWDGAYPFMPKGSSTKMDECSISKIKKWINTNYPQ